MQIQFQPMHLARRLHIVYLLGILMSLAPLLVEAQVMPESKERVRKVQVQEIERCIENVDGGDRSVKYLSYVVLPVIGLIGGLFVLRRFLLN
jgi:hypothetical protein